MADIIEEIIEDVEEVFSPKPGGMIDQHRKRQAEREAAAEEAVNESERIEAPSYKAVKTVTQSPEIIITNKIAMAAGSTAMILPDNPYRYRAVIQVNTANGELDIARDQNAALGGTGFPLYQFQPFITMTRGQIWGTNPLGTAADIRVMSECYAPERK
jgi:hypothetical protein